MGKWKDRYQKLSAKHVELIALFESQRKRLIESEASCAYYRNIRDNQATSGGVLRNNDSGSAESKKAP